MATIEDKGVDDRKHKQRFPSGRELINAARASTERARQARDVLASLEDDDLNDAYHQAYEVAQSVGADGRSREEPPMKDLRSLAQRVRGYVFSNKRLSHATAKENPTTGTNMRSSERKALATLGHRGGKKAAERWKNDPDGADAQAQRDKLAEANEQKKLHGNSTRAQVFAIAAEALARTGSVPTGAAIGRELGVTCKIRGLREAGLLPSK